MVIIHFVKKTLNINGWTTKDIYQNRVETKISNLENNLTINNDNIIDINLLIWL